MAEASVVIGLVTYPGTRFPESSGSGGAAWTLARLLHPGTALGGAQGIALFDHGGKQVEHANVQDDPKQRQPDISLARKALNWSPKVYLEIGLKKTIEYFKGGHEINGKGTYEFLQKHLGWPRK